MSNVYEICFYGGLVLAIIFLIISVILFIVLRIPKVIDELSGRAAKKGIKEKQQGKTTDSSISKKKEQAKYYNQNSGKIKTRDTVSQETRANNQDDTTESLGKEKTTTKKPAFTPQFDPEETAVLGANSKLDAEIARASGDESEAPTDVLRDEDDEATDVLRDESEEATDVLRSDSDEEATDVLKSDSDEEATDILKSEEPLDEDEEVTDVLKSDIAEEEATDVLKGEPDEEATDVLRTIDDEPATDVLRGDVLEEGDSTTVLASKKTIQLANKVKVIYNIVITHTNEKI